MPPHDILNLNLADDLQQFLQGETEAGQFTDASAYIEALLRHGKQSKELLESQLIAGLDSGEAVPLDEERWASIRAQVKQRLANG